MDQAEVALLRRVRMTVADAASARCEVELDGWPLLLVDRIGGCVRVNDLRSAAMFSHGVRLPSEAERLTVRAGAVGDELFVLVGDVVAVFVVPDVSAVHARRDPGRRVGHGSAPVRALGALPADARGSHVAITGFARLPGVACAPGSERAPARTAVAVRHAPPSRRRAAVARGGAGR